MTYAPRASPDEGYSGRLETGGLFRVVEVSQPGPSGIVPHNKAVESEHRIGGAEINMPRASWKGFLRLSLVSCPIYLNPAYHIYPDGPVATAAYRVISAAMAEAGVAGLGRLTLSRRERMVMVEPRGAGVALITLRAADEVRPAQFDALSGDVDPDAVAIARMIIERRAGQFDPSAFRDRYQDALRELIEAKMSGAPVKTTPSFAPNPVSDLMA